MDKEYGLKELEKIYLKTTSPIEINGREFKVNETVASFDKISLMVGEEIKSFINARGGFDNRPRVWWENTKELNLNFVQGIFSNTQFALMNNLKVLKKDEGNKLIIEEQETVESDAEGIVVCAHKPVSYLFIYDLHTGEPITDFVAITNTSFKISTPYKDLLLDYCWEYENGYTCFNVGSQLTNGTFALTGRTKVKDDITGQTRTGILKIPKLKLMSDLSIRLGKDASPLVGRLDSIAYPTGERGTQRVMEIQFLNDDIDSDM